MDLEGVERQLRQRLDAIGPAPRAELLHVLMLPDLERADRIGEFWGHPETRTFGELLIDLEEDKTPQGGARRDAAGKGQAVSEAEPHSGTRWRLTRGIAQGLGKGDRYPVYG